MSIHVRHCNKSRSPQESDATRGSRLLHWDRPASQSRYRILLRQPFRSCFYILRSTFKGETADMRSMSAVLPLNRSPPLAGSTSRANDPFSAPIGLGLSTTTLDESTCATASNAGGLSARNPKESRRSRWNWHLRAPVHGSKRLAIKNHFIACLGEFVGSVLFLFLALGSARWVAGRSGRLLELNQRSDCFPPTTASRT